MANGIQTGGGTDHAPGPIDAGGALLGDFQIVGNLPPDEVPAAIERDRAIFVARPGFYRKLIPLRTEPGGRLFCSEPSTRWSISLAGSAMISASTASFSPNVRG